MKYYIYLNISDLEKKIEPLFNSVQNKLREHFKYIRAQIEALWQEDVRFLVLCI
jgi:hypothetical protein